ncbi:hypothetical protein D6219_06660 [Coxiella burnetii]|nr:hypothetical protein COXBURSA331_A1391 [Coxiella burnetii RSA 331]ARI66039.1 hypothetical protein B7L74_06410 [Coxiella burnetii]AZV75498.1 hypothetical protein D6219_06660 [Coxiella burnetii]OYK80098.1 hypothetical protein CbuD7E6568_06845 [Coxiella burnetii]OYK82179.1 hypothetical protein CbuD7D7780_06875 [Coxiella burnetii]
MRFSPFIPSTIPSSSPNGKRPSDEEILNLLPAACRGTLRMGFPKGNVRARPLGRRRANLFAQAKYYQE